jgi:hypothetical protein
MQNIVLYGIFIFLLASCTKKEAAEINPIIEPITTTTFKQFEVSAETFVPNSKFLKREVHFRSNRPAMKYVRMFYYDADNRCYKIHVGIIDSSLNNPQFISTHSIAFNYEGASLQPVSLSSVRTVFPNLVTTFFYKYNNQGLKVMDSVRVKNLAGEPADITVQYVYNKGRVYTTPVLTGFSIDGNPFDTLELLQAGNIGRLISRVHRAGSSRTTTYAFTYDQAINPYNKVNIANSFYFENAAVGLGYNVPRETHYLGVATNNMLSYTTGSYIVKFRYVYDGDNYPVKKEMILPNDPNPCEVTYMEY